MEEVEDFRRKVEEELKRKRGNETKTQSGAGKIEGQLERSDWITSESLRRMSVIFDFVWRKSERRTRTRFEISRGGQRTKIAFRKNQRKLDRERKDIEMSVNLRRA